MTIQEAKDQAARESNFRDWQEAIYLGNELVHDRLVDKAMEILEIALKSRCQWYNGAGIIMCAGCGAVDE